MLRGAAVADLRTGRVSRADGYVVIAMRHYPRGVKRDLSDEYLADLAPDLVLFTEFRAAKMVAPDHHNEIFDQVGYEDRFSLPERARVLLEHLATRSTSREVFLVCQCGLDQKCHRDLLLLLARHLWQAPIVEPLQAYPRFLRRLARQDVFR